MEQDFKTVYTAGKRTYGTGFFKVCDTLDELKRAIVKHHHNPFDDADISYTDKDYTEELFQKTAKNRYDMFEVRLHKSEKIEFDEYDGTSGPFVAKKDPNLLSTMNFIPPKED